MYLERKKFNCKSNDLKQRTKMIFPNIKETKQKQTRKNHPIYKSNFYIERVD